MKNIDCEIYISQLITFFDKKGSCYGVLVINKEGKYNYIIGEYSHIDIQNLINSLK